MFGMDVDPNEILEGLKGASDFEVRKPWPSFPLTSQGWAVLLVCLPSPCLLRPCTLCDCRTSPCDVCR
jgi:hypothetical protein